MLIPFWGQEPDDPDNPAWGRYDRYAETGATFLRLDTLENCDAAIFPQPWEMVIGRPRAEESAAAFIAEAHAASKPPVIFFWDDSSDPIELDATIFRTSLHRSQPRPVVGFCGYAAPEPEPTTTLEKARTRLRALGGRRRTGWARSRGLAYLERHPEVETNFVLRDAFWGGAISSTNPETWLRLRQEYVQNIVESDYVLCARGGGNFSYRLYETLSCGRIPVFIDTDCVLPFDFMIDWRKYCVWVEERDLAQIGNQVAAFHAALGPTEFEELQRACRRLWETHLSPEGFFSHFHMHFT
jgi:glycosyltransferase involved in cell wall biosynthesis